VQSVGNIVADRRTPLFGSLAVLLAIWGEWALFTQRIVLDGLILSSLAVVLFVRFVLPGQRLVARIAPSEPEHAWTKAAQPSFSMPLLVASVICAAATWLFSSGNRFRMETVIFWILAVVLYWRTFWVPSRAPSLSWLERMRGMPRRDIAIPWSAVALGGVILVGAFFRYYQISSVPAEPTSDIAEKLLDIRDVLNGQRPIFFTRNTGREPLEFYMAVPFVMVFGLSHLALKVLTATVSLLTVPLVYLIGRDVGGARFGLLAAFFLAVSKWDVAIGRVGLRFPYYPFFVALAFLFLLRALRHGRRNDYLLCGLATGVGLYGYSPFRAMIPLIGAAVLFKMAFDWNRGRDALLHLAWNALLCLGAVLVVMVPLAHYMAENPGMFWFRALTRVASVEVPVAANPIVVFAGNVVNGLAMFNWRGDVVWVNTVPGDPVLDYVSGGLFLLGVAWCLFSLLKDREPISAYLVAALLILMLPSMLSIAFPGENPSVVRAGGDTPIVSLIVAAPVYLVASKLGQGWPGRAGRWAVSVALFLVMAVAARASFDRYFVDYAIQYRHSSINSSEIAAVINGFARSIGARQNAYIKSWPYWVDTRLVAFAMGDPDWNNVLMTPDDVSRQTPPPGNKLYILNKDDKEAVQRLQQKFPQGQLREQPSVTPGKEFLVFFVPASP